MPLSFLDYMFVLDSCSAIVMAEKIVCGMAMDLW